MKFVEFEIVGNASPDLIGKKIIINLLKVSAISEWKEPDQIMLTVGIQSLVVKGIFADWNFLTKAA